MTLSERIRAGESIEAIGAWLDTLDHAGRVTQMEGLSRADQRTLFDRAASAEPLDLDWFVPAEGALHPVIHQGWNSLPLPGLFRRFQKRFARPESGGERLFGYNEGSTRPYIGPGFFVAIPTAHRDDWAERGAVVIDYFQVPDEAVPAGWPQVVPNSKGLQVLVYHHTRDFMRRVSQHMSVGKAFKEEKELGAYFVLTREDLQAS